MLVQLIEKVRLKESVWLTFWNVDKKRDISFEIKNPSQLYEVGEIFAIDTTMSVETHALVAANLTQEEATKLGFLMPVPSRFVAPVSSTNDVPAQKPFYLENQVSREV